MSAPITAWPLSWPISWRRTSSDKRLRAAFAEHSVARASREIIDQVRLMHGRDLIISTNVRLRLDGLPYSDQRAPDDPGAAVYFLFNERPIVFACDRWRKVEHNLWAIARHIENLRASDRYGVGELEQAFAGYAALPAPAAVRWWEVLGVPRNATIDLVRASYRNLARENHPDAGGEGERFLQIQRAWEEAQRESGLDSH